MTYGGMGMREEAYVDAATYTLQRGALPHDRTRRRRHHLWMVFRDLCKAKVSLCREHPEPPRSPLEREGLKAVDDVLADAVKSYTYTISSILSTQAAHPRCSPSRTPTHPHTLDTHTREKF